jgi:hypothetical protein
VFPGDNFVTVAMRHVNEPAPSVLEKRPEVPLRLAVAVERALEKDPAKRFGSMGEFTDELQACLEPIGTEGDQEPTLIVRSPVVRESRRRERGRRSAWPLVVLLAGLALGAIALGLYLARDLTNGGSGNAGGPIRLKAVASYDPYGDKGENPDLVRNATDRNDSTAWQTETYRHGALYNAEGNPKPGVGIVLAASKPSKPAALILTTDTPGFTAVVKAGASQGGPFPDVISKPLAVVHRTTFRLTETSAAKYFLIWIKDLGGHTNVLINEVKAS